MKVTHATTATGTDAGTGEIHKAEWNADHTVAIQYPGLKPSTPTYDFASASLDGAFSAHSSQGSFATSNCMTQGVDWCGSSLEMQFSAQMGAIYVTHSNGDLDFHVGGIGIRGSATTAVMMFGIAALDSAGTGVGTVVYNDNNAYSAAITTWAYASFNDSWTGAGHNIAENAAGHWWLRLKRISGTWTAYASLSGRAWDKVFSTRSDSVTVDRLVFGLFLNTSTAYNLRLTADYFQVDT